MEKNRIMSVAELEEKKEKIIAAINHLPEDKLTIVEAFLQELNDQSIDHIYKKAVKRYDETLQKLAQ